jgi:hypothetical protein
MEIKSYKCAEITDPNIRMILGLDNQPPRNKEKYKGRMVYEHKTGGYIEVLSPQYYSSNKKFFTRSGNRSILKQV